MAKKKAPRGTPRRKKKAPKKPTALARIVKTPEILPAAPKARSITSDEVELGDFGLVKLVVTPEQEAKLNAPVEERIVSLLPQGQVYVSHIHYTRFLNEVFGRCGWALAPVTKPRLTGKSVVVGHILYVAGVPVSFAEGGQDFHETNRDQAFHDAVEAAYASALRRAAKHIGVWLELWDREWGEAFKDRFGRRVRVKVKKGGEEKTEYWWRRKDQRPYWQEGKGDQQEHGGDAREGASSSGRGSGDSRVQTPPPQQERPAGTNTNANDAITQEQRKRLFTIAKRAGRTDAEISVWLKERYRLESSKDIKRKDYDAICNAVEAPGRLPLAETRDLWS